MRTHPHPRLFLVTDGRLRGGFLVVSNEACVVYSVRIRPFRHMYMMSSSSDAFKFRAGFEQGISRNILVLLSVDSKQILYLE